MSMAGRVGIGDNRSWEEVADGRVRMHGSGGRVDGELWLVLLGCSVQYIRPKGSRGGHTHVQSVWGDAGVTFFEIKRTQRNVAER